MYSFAKRAGLVKSSAVRDILKIINAGNVISFAGGLPPDELFPVDAMKEAFERTFATGGKALQYGLTEGFIPLREVIVDRMAKKGIHTRVDDVLLTTGSQQAIDLFSRTMFDPGDVVLTENPTYLAALQVFQSYEVNIIPVSSDEDGMLPDDLEEKIQAYSPKSIYVVPTFSNPVGKVWSLERRKALVDLAQKYKVVVLEDDPYGEVQFNPEEKIVPITALDDGNHVLYTSTYSKTVTPALRTGWVVGSHPIIRTMAQAKQAADLHSDSLSQQALYHLYSHFDVDTHVHKLINVYKQRMEVMEIHLQEANLQNMSYVRPRGGMFLWITLADTVNTTELLDEAVKRGVAYVPGAPFYVSNPELNTLRLNYSHSSPEEIKKGIQILTDVLQGVSI